MYFLKANLYNETFNGESMVYVVWRYHLLSSDISQLVWYNLCLDSSKVHQVRGFLDKETMMCSFKWEGAYQALLYRWR